MRRRPAPRLPPVAAAVLGVVLAAGVTAAIVPTRGDITVATPALALVVPIVSAGLVGGRWPALVTALAATIALNLAFIPPYWTLKVDNIDDFVALVVFLVVATAVGSLVAREGARRLAAEGRAADLARINAELVALQEERHRLTEEANRVLVLEEIDEQRAALLRSVSHDLRTPLATIRAVASDLQSDATYDHETRRELLTLVADEAERLDRLVANLLSLSRIEAGALHPQRQAVAIDELVAHVLARHQRVLRDRRVRDEVPRDLPFVDGDYTQIDQVVSNLLENASRHAPPGSTITVGARRHDEAVDIWVDDEGTGVAPFERQRIFEPFRRGEGSTSSGIGLAICKAIVEAHGGTIEATTSSGGGARFLFSLPARNA